VSVAAIVTAAVVLIISYRFGRTHAAWKHLQDAKRAVAVHRRHAWMHTLKLAMGTAALLVTLGIAAYDAGH